MEIKEIVKEIIRTKINKNISIQGILFYGSQCYQTFNSDSDIDILFLSEGENKYRGFTKIQGYCIDYHIKPYQLLKEECKHAKKGVDAYLFAIFQNGQIIYDKNGKLNELKNILKTRKELPIQKEILKKQEGIKLLNECTFLLERITKNDHSFWMVYYVLLNTIRIDYQKREGITNLPVYKVNHLYADQKYAMQYYQAILPSSDFIHLFQKALITTDQLEACHVIEQMMHLLNLNPFKGNLFYEEPRIVTPNTKTLKEQASTLITKYQKAKMAILKNTDDSRMIYAVTIDLLRIFYEIQCYQLNNGVSNAIVNYRTILEKDRYTKLDLQFISLYLKASEAESKMERLDLLEKIYRFALKDIPIEEEEYFIRVYRM